MIKFRVTGVSIANVDSLQMSNQEGVKLQKSTISVRLITCENTKSPIKTGVKYKNCPIKEE